MIRPVTEYACVVWHTSLTKGQTKHLETIQRRAIKIIFANNPDDVANALYTLPSLSDRRDKLTRDFFNSLLDPASCLHELIPAKRDNYVISRVRQAVLHPPLFARTELFKKSTVVYGLNNFQ